MDDLPQDPMILFSYVNMKLRDEYESLSKMCAEMDLDEFEIRARLGAAGFEYNEEQNKFW